jgi:hypothetical protein
MERCSGKPGKIFEWRCFDALGNLKCQHREREMSKAIKINTGNWEAGTYQVLLFIDGHPASGNKMIIHH